MTQPGNTYDLEVGRVPSLIEGGQMMTENPLFLTLAKLGHPTITLDDRNIFDSRIEGDHLGPVGFTSSAEDRRAFYDLKYRYYTAKVKSITEAKGFVLSPLAIDNDDNIKISKISPLLSTRGLQMR